MVHYCPACNEEIDGFGPGPRGRPGASCPRCRALERHRFLIVLLSNLQTLRNPSARVLDVAPHRQIRKRLSRHLGKRYVAVDLFPGLPIDVMADMCSLPFADRSFDLVICYHVLEHIPDDLAAMSEVARVLRPEGVGIVQVPRRRGLPTEEDPQAPEEERVMRFGQADHIRMYGDDFEDRLMTAGLHSDVVGPEDVFDAPGMKRFGLRAEEVWLCRPDPTAAPVFSDGDLREMAASAAWEEQASLDAVDDRVPLAKLAEVEQRAAWIAQRGALTLLKLVDANELAEASKLAERAAVQRISELQAEVSDLSFQLEASRQSLTLLRASYDKLRTHPAVRSLLRLRQEVARLYRGSAKTTRDDR